MNERFSHLTNEELKNRILDLIRLRRIYAELAEKGIQPLLNEGALVYSCKDLARIAEIFETDTKVEGPLANEFEPEYYCATTYIDGFKLQSFTHGKGER